VILINLHFRVNKDRSTTDGSGYFGRGWIPASKNVFEKTIIFHIKEPGVSKTSNFGITRGFRKRTSGHLIVHWKE